MLSKSNSFPIYIPSRGRSGACKVADIFINEGINSFLIAVEPKEYNDYLKKYKPENLLKIDKDDCGVAYVRNFIKKHSIYSFKCKYHWQFDDNIKSFYTRVGAKNIKANALDNIIFIENYICNYNNIAVAGMNYTTFAFAEKKEIKINKSPASAFIVNNNCSVLYRKGVPVDIDYTLQCLSRNWCTVVFSRLLIDKPGPMKMPGGCTEIEYGGEKRKHRTLKLKEYWPKIVNIKYKYERYGLSIPPLNKIFKQVPLMNKI